VYYKIAGDFEGASDVWKFVSAVGPTEAQATAFGNLGDLYMNFIKDYPKAEESYRQAINLKPDEISYYRDLHMLYRYLYKTDTTLAADILVEGIEKNPNNEDLLRLQAEYNAAK
jgi:tetratricopeptide (TPR) repeat protein